MIELGFICQYFIKLFPISTLRGRLTSKVVSSHRVNYHYKSFKLVLLCSDIYLQNHVEGQLRRITPSAIPYSSTDDKNLNFTAKKSVDLMLPMAKIHSKVKSQQLLHVKSIKTVQGPNH